MTQYKTTDIACKNVTQMSTKIDGIYQYVSDAEQTTQIGVERFESVHQNMSHVIADIQSRIVNIEHNIKEPIKSHDLSLERFDQNISTEADRIDGHVKSLLQQVEEIYQLLNKTGRGRRGKMDH